jgi:hypothetical protein
MLKILLVVVFLVVPVGIASYLWFQNRYLPELNSKLVPVFFLGAIGMLFSVWYSLKGETRDQHFASTVYFHRSDLHLLDEHDPRRHLYGGEQFNARLRDFIGHRIEHDERFRTEGSGDRGREGVEYLYCDMVFLKLIDRFFWAYGDWWDVRITSVRHANDTESTVSAIKPDPDSASLTRKHFLGESRSNDAFLSLLSDFAKQDTPAKMTVPPKTRASITTMRYKDSLVLANPFAEVSITISYRGGALGIGDYAWFLDYDRKKSEEFWSEYLEVDCKAEFSRWRSGHADMVRYKRWVDTMFAEIQYQLSDEERMKRARDYRDLVRQSK